MSEALKSISALAKAAGVAPKELFQNFCERGFIVRANDKWNLTEQGKAAGGKLMVSQKYGEYVAFPEEAMNEPSGKATAPGKYLSVTKIGEMVNMSPQNLNAVLSELGWIVKAPVKGWNLTKAGENLGAIQKIYDKTGIPYVMWPEDIVGRPAFAQSIQEYKGESSPNDATQTSAAPGFREKFEAKHRAQDGHFVRSRAELIIDNWLYMAEISHAYERKIPIGEEMYCDFYIPSGKVYVEFWGMENDPQYALRKKTKIETYKKYDLNLIELRDADVQSIDDILPGLLLKFGVKSY